MKQYIRIRNEENMVVLESVHKSEDHRDVKNWDVINMLSAKQLSTLAKEKVEDEIKLMKDKKEFWKKSGNYEEYPF